jgi:single-stranded DNA-specific DHH superfamily exonuclease
MKKAIIVYHYEDNDGCLSGAMMYEYLMNLGMKNDEEKREIDTLPANYNKLSEMFKTKKDVDEYFSKYDEIVFTDISFNDPQFMLEVKKLGKYF